jgi:hypothetical protein
MSVQMATSRRYLSSLSLVLAASTNDPVRDALQATAHHFSRDVAFATVLVAIGVALEGVDLFDQFARKPYVFGRHTAILILSGGKYHLLDPVSFLDLPSRPKAILHFR